MKTEFVISANRMIADRIMMMMMVGDTTGIRPGQFVEIALPGKFLRRPISVCDCHEGLLTIVYKVVGEGTAQMAKMQEGETLDVLTCLGNGYDLSKAGDEVLLVGGGVGVPPLFYAARALRAQGKTVRVVLGFNKINEVFAEEDFRRLGCEVTVCTADGSHGVKGFVTDGIEAIGDGAKDAYYYACGPLPMLRALVSKVGVRGQVSMEERMGCGFGICVGCSIQTENGVKRVCKEGPVFEAGEIRW